MKMSYVMCTYLPQGEAEAYAIEVKAKAEAEQMAKKADAWKEYKEAALVDMMLQVRVVDPDPHLFLGSGSALWLRIRILSNVF